MLYTTTMNVEQEIAAGKEHTKENIINNLNEKTNNKFIKRFMIIENKMKSESKSFQNSSLEELNKYWELSK